MNPIIYILFGVFAYGLAETLSGRYMKSFDKLTAMGLIIIGSLVTVVYSIILVLVLDISVFIPDWKILAMIAAIGIVSFYANKLYYTSLKSEEASTTVVIGMISIVVTTILGRLIFSEVVMPIQWLGIVLVLFSAVLVSLGHFDLRQILQLFKLTKSKQFALAGAILYGVTFTMTKFVVTDIHPFHYSVIEVFIIFPLYFIIARKELGEQFQIVRQSHIFKAILPVVSLYFVYNITRYLAYSKNLQLPIVDAVDNSVVFVILALEIFIFRIKQDNYLFKILVAIIAFSGIMLIYVGS